MGTRLDPSSNHNTEQCSALCLDCYRICTETAMNHCLQQGGTHVEPRHFRLMVHCAEICRTAAAFMLGGSDLHGKVCAVCADVCQACAQSCQDIGGMEACAQACRLCAESCRSMAGARPSAERAVLLQPAAAPM